MSYFKNMTGFVSMERVVSLLESDIDACFQGLVEVWNRQTADERNERGTKHKNLFGFSKKHVTPGSKYALAYLTGRDTELSSEELAEARKIALHYRKQLWMIGMGMVPENNLGA